MKDKSIFYFCEECESNILQTEKDDHFCQDYEMDRWVWMNMSFEKQQETIKKIYAKPHTKLKLVNNEKDAFMGKVTYTRKEWSRFTTEIQEKLIQRAMFHGGEIVLVGLTRKQAIIKKSLDFLLKREDKDLKKIRKLQEKIQKSKTGKRKTRKTSKAKTRSEKILDKVVDEFTPSFKKTKRSSFF